jgi:hypothetical protein
VTGVGMRAAHMNREFTVTHVADLAVSQRALAAMRWFAAPAGLIADHKGGRR